MLLGFWFNVLHVFCDSQVCSFGHSLWRWNSQPLLKFGMQGGDFMLSSNILLSGNNYRKIALLFKFMRMGMVAESTFFRIQDAYCIEPVQEYWEQIRSEVIERLRDKDHVVVLGEELICFCQHSPHHLLYNSNSYSFKSILMCYIVLLYFFR